MLWILGLGLPSVVRSRSAGTRLHLCTAAPTVKQGKHIVGYTAVHGERGNAVAELRSHQQDGGRHHADLPRLISNGGNGVCYDGTGDPLIYS